MKKLILILFITICSLPILKAETSEDAYLQMKVDSLTSQVDSLSRELVYFKVNFELYTLNNDLSIFAVQISDYTQDISDEIHRQGFYEDSYIQYEQLYDAYKEKFEKQKELVAVTYLNVTMQQKTYNFSESENNRIESGYKMTISGLKIIEISLNNMRSALDGYYKLMRMKKR